MSYALYVGRNHSRTGHAWLGGYGDEPSSHWLEIVAEAGHPEGTTIEVGAGPEAAMPGLRTRVPQVARTMRHVRVSYSHYLGVPAPITNGGLNAAGVAVRDVWSPSRPDLIAMTPKDQTGFTYSDLARAVLERATSARGAVMLCAELIATHGEVTYGGNSHLFADAEEAWVMIQFAGGRGLWVAERLGPDDIRALRPGYVLEVPVEEPGHPDFLWSENFVSLAREMGWHAGGPFDANAVYGDGRGRWEGVRWIEAEVRARAARSGGIGLDDMIWALRTERLTGDTAGYGQIVPLVAPGDPGLRVLWHAAAGALAAPFSPVFLGQEEVPAEYGPHRYLTEGESRRFHDMRKAVSGGAETLSRVPQGAEVSIGAFQASRRLMALMQLCGEGSLGRVHGALARQEGRAAALTQAHLAVAEAAIAAGRRDAAMAVLTAHSAARMAEALSLVQDLGTGLAAELRLDGVLREGGPPKGFDQIW